jgi:hypothetical protein
MPLLHRGEPHRTQPTALIGHVGRMQTAIKSLRGTHAGLPLGLSRSRPENQMVRGLLKRHAAEAEAEVEVEVDSGSDGAVRKELVT